LHYDTFGSALNQYFDVFHRKNSHTVSIFTSLLSIIEIYFFRKYNNDPSLNIKLDKLIELNKDVIELFIDEPFEYSKKIVAIRRYYIHGKGEFSKENLNTITYQLENIFRVILLSEIGFSEDEIIKMINKAPWYWSIQ
jgi:hypothetical protein